jgi:hypothetical protein
MNLKEKGCEAADWIHMAQGRDQWRALASTIMNFRVPQHSGNVLNRCVIDAFSRKIQLHGVN